MAARSPALPTSWFLFLVALATILGAWGFELIGGLPPCPLCLKQRWAFYAALPLLALAVILLARGRAAPGAGRKLGLFLLVLASIALLAGAALAFYHAGVEWKLWDGPQSCGGVDLLAGSDSVLPDLDDAPLVRCDEAPWRLFGLSLAGYNFLISLGLGALGLWAAKRDYGSSSASQ